MHDGSRALFRRNRGEFLEDRKHQTEAPDIVGGKARIDEAGMQADI